MATVKITYKDHDDSALPRESTPDYIFGKDTIYLQGNQHMLARTAVIAFCLLVLCPSFGGADEAYDSCMKSSDGTNTAWSQCGAMLLGREETQLTAAWKSAFALTSGQTKTDLLAEQRKWITFKDAACSFYANGEWGREGNVLYYPLCLARVISNRTKALNDFAIFFRRP